MKMHIVPVPDELTRPYWEGLRQHELRLQCCEACGSWWHPPQHLCPRCRSGAWAWRASSGRGRVHSYTVVRHAVHPALVDKVPYVVALVELEEGPRLVTNIVGQGAAELPIGAPVEVVFEELPTGDVLAQFTLAATESRSHEDSGR